MKQLCKRSLAAILLLVMLVGYFSGITIRANAAGYTYNWGTREDVADQTDFARSTAEEWYAKYNTSYAELSQYAGSSNNSSVPSSALYQKLRSLMRGAVTDTTSYEDIKTLCKYTDCQNGGGKISSFYSGTSIGPSWDGSWNREHTWPNSKGDANGSGENDIFMLRPTSYAENSSRGNKAYGESSSFYNPNSESGGTYDLRGDVARIILFVYVRWQDYTSSSAVLYGTSGVIESRAVLLKWMEEDPVDTWELGRNDSCQSITGTRNVFVDYPELAFLMLGDEIPDNYTSPSGVGSAVSYNITAQSNNTSYGTVSLSGKTITASPKTGYYASGYTVTSGSATVTQNGNTFTVNASSDCTIRINFAARKTVTVSFAGANVVSQTGYAGDVMTLPTVTAPDGYNFLGWMTSALPTETTEKPSYHTNSFTPTQSTTLYALYSYVDETSSGGTGDYVKVTAAPADWSGEYLIVYEANSYIFDGSLTSFDAVSNYKAVTISGETISAEQGDPYKFTIAAVNGGYSIQGTSNNYIGNGSNSNALTTSSSALVNKLSLDANGNANIVSDGGAYLRYNANSGQNRFRYYKSSSYSGQKPVALYVKDGSAGTTYYTTSITDCNHTNVIVDAAVEATCRSTGLTEGSHCANCGEVLVAQTVTPIVACDYQPVVTPPTCTEQGYSTYTCIWCGEVDEVSDYVDVLGHSYGDNGVCGVCGAGKTLLAGWNLILTDCIGINFHLNLSAEEAAETQVRFTVNGTATTVDASNAQIKDGKYVFSLALAAVQMTEKVTVEILSNGSVIQTGEYSVRQYAQTILNDQEGEFTDATKALVTQMLHYGAAAQTYFNYKVNDLANAGLEAPTQSNPQTSNVYKVTGKVDGIDFYGATMMFRDKIAVRCYFTVTGDISTYSFTVNGNTCTPVQKGDRYYIEIVDINPQDLNDVITVKVNNTLTVTYSPMNYIVNMGQKGSQKLQVLVQALYDYHLAAVEYLAEQ